jgi:hypothetical protein
VLATTAWLGALSLVLDGGGMVEELALPLQFAAFHAYGVVLRRGSWARYASVLGATAALTLLLKPNLLGVHVAIAVHVAAEALRTKRWLPALAALAEGALVALVILGGVAVYFWRRGALDDLVEQAIVFNMVYAKASPARVAAVVAGGAYRLLPSLLPIVAVVGWLLALRGLARPARRRARIFSVALVAWPLLVVGSSATGRAFDHYYIAWIAGAAPLVGLVARRLLGVPRAARVVLAVSIVIGVLPVRAIVNTQRWTSARKVATEATLRVVASTRPTDTVLMWGAEAAVNVLAGRASPTRYVYQYPLYQEGYHRPQAVHDFVSDLSAHPPRLIVDTAATNDEVPPLDGEARRAWAASAHGHPLPEEVEAVFAFIHERYERAEDAGGWTVYVRRDAHSCIHGFAR